MNKGWKTAIIILIIIILMLLVSIATYYFAPRIKESITNDNSVDNENLQSNTNISDLENKEEGKTENEVKAPIIKDGTEGYIRKISLNGKEHTISFKYKYEEDQEKRWDGQDYIYHYIAVGFDIYFDNSLIKKDVAFTEFGYSEYLSKDPNLYMQPITLKDAKEYMLNQESLDERIDLQAIKGRVNNQVKEYLYMTVNGKADYNLLMPQEFIPFIINEEGKVLKEITDNNLLRYANIGLVNEKENAKYDFRGFNIYTEDNLTKIEYIAHNVDEKTKEIFWVALKTLTIEDENIKEAVGVLLENEYVIKGK